MQRVRLTLDAGGREAAFHPMYDLLANAPFVERATAIQWSRTDDTQAFLHYVEGDAEAFRAATAEAEAVLAVEVVPAGGGGFYAFVKGRNTEPLGELLGAVEDGTVLPVPPVEYHPNGTVSFTLIGSSAEVQAAIEAVPDPITVRVDEVGRLERTPGMAETGLSPRQREALQVARDLGYYEIPREADHEDIADAMGCARSTAAEHLRKAESKVLAGGSGGGGEANPAAVTRGASRR